MDLFRVQLNCIDSYQATPTPLDPQLRKGVQPSQLHKEPKVPVIRVFGTTETGQKVCAHIHGAFPYLYIEYNGSLVPDEAGAYMHQLHLSIDYALSVSYRRNPFDGCSKFVARITLVKGIPFYGFHVGYRYYLKIYMLNPIVMTRLADILLQGLVMNKVFQPYEAHLQYLLQWMTDYNLYGCGYINCRKVTFRSPVPSYEEIDSTTHLWHDHSIPNDFITRDSAFPRVSHCAIEVDVCVQDILNRHDIRPRNIHHDFVEYFNPRTLDEKLVNSMAGLWRDETRRRKLRMGDLDPDSSPFPPEVLISMSADPRNSSPGGWIHEEEYKEKILAIIQQEKESHDRDVISFETFVKPSPLDANVKTSLEAVEDLYPENLLPKLGLIQEKIDDAGDNDLRQEDMDVDEKRIRAFNFEDDEYNFDSDEELMKEIELSQKRAQGSSEDEFLSLDTKDPLDIDSSAEQMPTAQNPLSTEHLATRTSQKLDMYSIRQRSQPTQQIIGRKLPENNLNRQLGPNKRQKVSFDVDFDHSSNSQDGTTKTKADIQLTKPRMDTWYPDNVLAGEIAQTFNSTNSQSDHPRSDAMENREQITTNSNKASSKQLWKTKNSSQNQTLNFPVVKDPHDPSTLSRLSQRTASQSSKWASSQELPFPEKLPIKSDLSDSLSSAPSSADSLPLRKVMDSMAESYPSNAVVLAFKEFPPSWHDVTTTMERSGLPSVIHQDAFYSNELDVPERPREWAGKEFKLGSNTIPYLPDFDPTGMSDATYGKRPPILPDKLKEERVYERKRLACSLRSWAIEEPPPTFAEVLSWQLEEEAGTIASGPIKENQLNSENSSKLKSKLSQIEGATQKPQQKFRYEQEKSEVYYEAQYMSTMSLEIHINTRGKFFPNPEQDEVQCIFWCLQSTEDGLERNGAEDGTRLGIVVLSQDGIIAKQVGKQSALDIDEETSELDLMIRIVDIVRQYDPDILTGFEVHGSSWGYLIERARLKYDYNLCDELSRMKSQSHGRFGKENDRWGFNTTSTIRVTGRHMINIWRAMRSELNLLGYTMENVVFHILQRRIPHYTWADLTKWYTGGKPRDLAKVVNYFVSRVQLDLKILEKNELIARTSEQARLLGVDFYSVFSRGSQFKVESLMFRIAKAENFMLVSPSRKQVGGQNALECLPLVMEPQSAFYNGPVLVLDFQSLYPSVMIAYNYCYSTFLGRIVNWRGGGKMGFTEYKRQRRLLELIQDHVNIAPNGMMYAKPTIRKSLLAKMLTEILETRVMVKSGMQIDKENISLQRLLNNRQLALKLIANVTYGYSSASFSGRMPCSEIADSIVQTGRETLERAIALIHSVKRWGAEVVYGDTDSLFVYLKGRTKDQAFDIGNEIARTLTNVNPRPIKLKFEKVYFPSVLLAKKRYVGFKYESKDQVEPEFDAKGIETVRRDGTIAEQKIEEKALKILFRTADLSQVKSYFQRQCEKIMKGSVSVQDFCFAREVRLGTYSDKGPPPAGALISTRRMLEDPRAEPQYGERVPYVVITGAPGSRLIDRCVAPEELLENDQLELDAEYYISKNLIPPLERIFNLMGANVRNWYDEMPKFQRIRKVDMSALSRQSRGAGTSAMTIESYMKSSSCIVCKEKLIDSEGPICMSCIESSPTSILTIQTRLSDAESKVLNIQKVCQACSGLSPLDEVRCDNKDCPVFYTRVKQAAHLRAERAIGDPAMHRLLADEVTNDMEW
ncbi:DNA polymerase-like protein zeta catalytic subunit [Xylogone sp. PMI_703]|nr:DNA polymerase-like protein zeta catalytic subunit [Xylogone sp. PMI_703]